MSLASTRRPLALTGLLVAASCSSNPSQGSSTDDDGTDGASRPDDDGGSPPVTSNGASTGTTIPSASAFAYYGPDPDDGSSQVLNIFFTSDESATCGSKDAIILGNLGSVAGVKELVFTIIPTASSVPAGTYAWENYGGVAYAQFEAADAQCGTAGGGVYGGLLQIDSIDSTAVTGSFRLDIATPSTTGTFTASFCGTVPDVEGDDGSCSTR